MLTAWATVGDGGLSLTGDILIPRPGHATIETLGASSLDVAATASRYRLTAYLPGTGRLPYQALPDPVTSEECANISRTLVQATLATPPTPPPGWPAHLPLVTGPVSTLTLP
jgi:hypothetical protein